MRTARETYLALFRERYGVPLPQAARDRLPDHLNHPDERTQATPPRRPQPPTPWAHTLLGLQHPAPRPQRAPRRHTSP